MLRKLSPATIRNFMSFWPPFIGAGIRVKHVSDDWREATVAMSLHWYNKNYFGTHFGGSLFAMTDPFYTLLVVNSLGPGYLVWDQSSQIEFIKPGRERVYAHFVLTDEVLDAIKEATQGGTRHLVTFSVDITTASDEIIARVHKTLYVRLKPRYRG